MPAVSEATYLVVDLRRNQCVARYLAVAPHRVRWQESNLHLPVHMDATTPDSVDIADLAFFRANRHQAWRATMADCLASLPAGFDKVPMLFRAPLEYRRDIGQRGVQRWLNVIAEAARRHRGERPVEIVYLVEDDSAADDVRVWRKPAGSDGRVLIVPDDAGDLTGFALLAPEHSDLMGTVAWLGKLENVSASFRPRAYHWVAGQFEMMYEDQPPTEDAACGWLAEIGGQDADRATWSSLEEVERTGAAVYALIWQPYLHQQLATEVLAWRARRDRAQRVLTRMIRLREHLHSLADVVVAN